MSYKEKKELLKDFLAYILGDDKSMPNAVQDYLDHTHPNPICANCGHLGATELNPLCAKCEIDFSTNPVEG